MIPGEYFLSEKPKFNEIADEFLTFIKNKRLIIHNAEFDLAHLNNELLLIGKKKIDKNMTVDTLQIAREKFPGSQINLDALCKRYKIDNSRRTKHTAIIDCELLTKVYVNLLDQKEPSLNSYLEYLSGINLMLKRDSKTVPSGWKKKGFFPKKLILNSIEMKILSLIIIYTSFT